MVLHVTWYYMLHGTTWYMVLHVTENTNIKQKVKIRELTRQPLPHESSAKCPGKYLES